MAAPLAVAPFLRKGDCASGSFDPAPLFGLFPVTTLDLVRLQSPPDGPGIVQRIGIEKVEDTRTTIGRIPPNAVDIGQIVMARRPICRTGQKHRLRPIPAVRQETVGPIIPERPVETA